MVAAEARGFILGAALALELDAGFVPARKPGKLPSETVSAEYILEYGVDALEMHADALADGARVLIHDDLLATGGTARALAELVESLGGDGRRLRVPGRARVPRGPAAARRLRRPRADRLRRRVDVIVRRSRTVAAPVDDGVADRARPLPPAALVAADAARRGRELGRLDVGAADRQGARDPGRLPRRAVEGLASGGSGRRSWRGRRSSACSARSCRGRPGAGRRRAPRSAIEMRQKPKGWARFGGVMLRRAREAPGRRGAGRARRAGGGRRVSRRECVFWGWGEPGAGPSLPDHAAGFLRSELGVDGAVVSRPVALEEVRLRPPALGDALRTRLAARVAERARRRRRARGALPRQVLPRPAAPARGRLRGRAGRGRARRRAPSEVQAVLARVQRGGRGGGAVRRRHERRRRPRAAARALRRADLARPRPAGGDRVASTSARSSRGCAAGRGCRRPTTRSPSAASRSATRRRATSGRRSAAASRRARPASPRPATGGSRRTCVGAALRDARRRAREPRRCRPPPPGRRSSSS